MGMYLRSPNFWTCWGGLGFTILGFGGLGLLKEKILDYPSSPIRRSHSRFGTLGGGRFPASNVSVAYAFQI